MKKYAKLLASYAAIAITGMVLYTPWLVGLTPADPSILRAGLSVISGILLTGAFGASTYSYLHEPEYRLLEDYAREHAISFSSREDLCVNAQIHQMLQERIDTLQQQLAHYEQVKRFVLLPSPFSLERGELTNTLKIKRRVLNENYKKEIDSMYEE